MKKQFPRHSLESFKHRADVDIRLSTMRRLASMALLFSTTTSAYVYTVHQAIPLPVPSECKINDDQAIKNYEARIDEMVKSEPTDSRTLSVAANTPSVKIVASSPRDKDEDENIRNIVVNRLNYISPHFIEASGITTVYVQDINKKFHVHASGLFTTVEPDAITIDDPTLRSNIDFNLVKDPNYHDIDPLVTNIALHEMAHAAVNQFCGSPQPPREFINANNPVNTYEDENEVTVQMAGGFVSDYARTDPQEDIAETIQAIMGEPMESMSATVELHNDLADQDPVMKQKVAVCIAMLDKLEPGLGEIAIGTMSESYSLFPHTPAK